MPELPEVESLVQGLKPLVLNKWLREVHVIDQKISPLSDIRSFQVSNLERFGKSLLLSFTKGSTSFYLRIHLRMSGRLLYAPRDLTSSKFGGLTHAPELPELLGQAEQFLILNVVRLKSRPLSKYVRVVFDFFEGSLLFFDPRRFGTCELLLSYPKLSTSQRDPLSNCFSVPQLQFWIKNHGRRNIKSFLLDQSYIVGLGNIYVSEILFSSNINPQRNLGSLTEAETEKLYFSTVSILNAAIRNRGTTFSDYQGADGSTGNFQNMLQTYKREGQTCNNCGNTILRIVQQQRSTFYCACCQK